MVLNSIISLREDVAHKTLVNQLMAAALLNTLFYLIVCLPIFQEYMKAIKSDQLSNSHIYIIYVYRDAIDVFGN